MQDQINIYPRAHAFVSKWEGGYIKHRNDPGGATNYGVSLRFLRAISLDVNGDGDINEQDILALTPDMAMQLFHAHFWQAMNLDSLPPLVAMAVYDAAVNQGPKPATLQLQEGCNAAGMTLPALDCDGALGSDTLRRVRILCDTLESQVTLAMHVIERRERRYRYLAALPPKQMPDGSIRDYRPFLGGWLNRTSSLQGWINQTAIEMLAEGRR